MLRTSPMLCLAPPGHRLVQPAGPVGSDSRHRLHTGFLSVHHHSVRHRRRKRRRLGRHAAAGGRQLPLTGPVDWRVLVGMASLCGLARGRRAAGGSRQALGLAGPQAVQRQAAHSSCPPPCSSCPAHCSCWHLRRGRSASSVLALTCIHLLYALRSCWASMPPPWCATACSTPLPTAS